MSSDKVGFHTMLGKKAQQGDVERKHSGLGVLSGGEGLLGVVRGVLEQVCERTAQNGLEQRICVSERLGNDGVALDEVEAHSQVLVALTGEDECEASDGSGLDEVNAARCEQCGVAVGAKALFGTGPLVFPEGFCVRATGQSDGIGAYKDTGFAALYGE
jgi:hypothetical protein